MTTRRKAIVGTVALAAAGISRAAMPFASPHGAPGFSVGVDGAELDRQAI